MKEFFKRLNTELFKKIGEFLRSIRSSIIRFINYIRNRIGRILIFFIAPPILFLLLFNPLLTYKKEVLPDKQSFYTLYFLPDPDINNNPLYPIAKIINTSLNLDWYDICIENNSYILLNGARAKPEEFGESGGEMILEIFPLQRNLVLKQQHDFLKTKNYNENTETGIEYSLKLSAPPKSWDCIKLDADEKGFLFLVNSNVKIGNSYLPATDIGGLKMVSGDNTIEVKSNNSKLIVKTSIEAVVYKLIIVWLLFDGIILLVVQIKKYISKID